tara:strand:- start:230 stop:928 length:699 start_codon:yes stop_codon:yes gene_type:complete
MIKKVIFIILFLSNVSAYSQKVNVGLNLGTGISSQSLSSLDSKYTAGVKFNTIGGIPYRVDSYIGYNYGLMVELYFNLPSSSIDNDISHNKISLKSGLNYSSQGVVIEDGNKTRFRNNLTYLQIPILLNFKFKKFNILLGPQIHLLDNFKSTEFRSTSLSSSATTQSFDFDKENYNEKDPNFVFGVGYEFYESLSLQIKLLRSMKNITSITGEEWKNKSFEITFNYILNKLL